MVTLRVNLFFCRCKGQLRRFRLSESLTGLGKIIFTTIHSVWNYGNDYVGLWKPLG